MKCLKILLVDDEVALTELLQGFLAESGYECREVNQAVKALELIPIFEPDVVISDIRMPKMDGIALQKEIVSRHPAVRVIFLTGFADVANAMEAVNCGAFAFFRKPVDLSEILDALARIREDISRELLESLETRERRASYSRLKHRCSTLEHLYNQAQSDR